jgi:hypothetical protein
MPRTTGLYRPQHSIRRAFGRRHDHVYMSGPTCRSVERPPTKVAMLVNHSLDGVTLGARQHDARSTHQSSGNASEPRVWFTNCAAIVCPAPGVAGHPRAVGCPRQKKSQRVGLKDRAGSVRHGTSVRAFTLRVKKPRAEARGQCEHQPGCNVHAARGVEIVRRGNRDPLPRGVPRLLLFQQRALGGSPGTPGVNTSPVAMCMRPEASRSFGVATGIRCHAESPGFRRGLLFQQRALTRSPGREPGDTGCEHQPGCHAHAARGVEIVRRGNRDPLPRGVPRLPPGAFISATCPDKKPRAGARGHRV